MTEPESPDRRRGADGRSSKAAKPASDSPPAAAAPPPGPAAALASDTAVPPAPLELYLLRHADAGDSATWPGDDVERPLSKKGRRQAKALARRLRDLGFHADAVISSPLVRAVQTAKPVAKAAGVELQTDERLGYGFGKRELAALVQHVGAGMQRVVLVGHDPGFTDVASFLTGASISMAKGALARIDLAERAVRAGAGELRWLVPPDVVVR